MRLLLLLPNTNNIVIAASFYSYGKCTVYSTKPVLCIMFIDNNVECVQREQILSKSY